MGKIFACSDLSISARSGVTSTQALQNLQSLSAISPPFGSDLNVVAIAPIAVNSDTPELFTCPHTAPAEDTAAEISYEKRVCLGVALI